MEKFKKFECPNTVISEMCSYKIQNFDYERKFKKLQDNILGYEYTNDSMNSYTFRETEVDDIIMKFNELNHKNHMLMAITAISLVILIIIAIGLFIVIINPTM